MENETIKSVADATNEVAKTTGIALNTAERVGSFLYRILGEPIEILSGTYVTDPLRELRKRRLMSLEEKTEDFLKRKGVFETNSVSPALAVPLLENASLETDEEIHELWAKLLAEAMTDKTGEIDKRFVSAVSGLTPVSAQIMTYMYNFRETSRDWLGSGELLEAHLGKGRWRSFSYYELDRMGFEIDQLEHLCALSIIEHPLGKPPPSYAVNQTRTDSLEVETEQLVEQRDHWSFTRFGRKLVQKLLEQPSSE